MSLDDVRREALHDWLDERPPLERPARCEYEEQPPQRGRPVAPARAPSHGDGGRRP